MSALDAVLPPFATRAACRGLGSDLFFPESSESGAQARAVCATCPVCEECREYAIATFQDGIWGNTSEHDRVRIRRRRRQVA